MGKKWIGIFNFNFKGMDKLMHFIFNMFKKKKIGQTRAYNLNMNVYHERDILNSMSSSVTHLPIFNYQNFICNFVLAEWNHSFCFW